MHAEGPTRYHVARATTAMALGGLAVLAGVLFLGMLAFSEVRGRGTLWSVLWWVQIAVAVVLSCGLLRALWRLARPPVAIRLDEIGYVIDPLVGVGTRAAAWTDVVRVDSVQGADSGVVIRLRDGSSTRVVARLVAEPALSWVGDVDSRLNRAHGQGRR